MLLAVYRLGIFVNTPGVDRAAMNASWTQQRQRGGLLGLFNLFSGGALEQMSIFALGIMPYVSASIILQLLTVVVPALETLQKEGGGGRQKINQYTRYGTHRALRHPGHRHRPLAGLARSLRRDRGGAASTRWSSPTTASGSPS